MLSIQLNEENTNQPLSNNLFCLIRKDILSGSIKSGAKLTEQSICEKYNVSRTPVREGLRQLENEGLIENIPNRGAFVIGLNNQDISDMFELRRIAEVQAIEWAIERMSTKVIDPLEETFEFMEFYTLKNDIDKVLNINTTFHGILYQATGNKMLQQMLTSYQVYLKHSAPSASISDDYLTTILAEHKAIFEAVKSKNIAAGKKAMDYHMVQTKLRRMSSYF
ncbi:MAG: GntR family transcriptional regulator [Peptostreptococcaceae bacterium]|nr:GntR family transcriptional regulator [Peptostreptococcaceae bacterium]